MIQLIIKGSKAEVKNALKAHGLPHDDENFKRIGVGDCIVEVPLNDQNALIISDWFNEPGLAIADAPEGGFPIGTCLWYSGPYS